MSGFCFCYSKKALGKIIIAMKQNCKVEKRILSVAVIKSFQDTFLLTVSGTYKAYQRYFINIVRAGHIKLIWLTR